MTDLEPLLLELFDNAQECLFVTEVTQEGRFKFERANPAWERTAGMVSAELAGRFLDDVIPAEDVGKVFARYRRCVELAATTEYEDELAMAAGPAWLRVTLTPIRNAAGRVHRLFGVARDITPQKRAVQRLELIDFALNQVREEVYLVDEHSQLQYVNDEACRALGYSREELLHLSVAEIDPAWHQACKGRGQDLLSQRGSIRGETSHRTKSGRQIPVEFDVNYFEYGGRPYQLVLSRDITERKQADDALRRHEWEFRTLAEHLPDNIVRYDAQCRAVYCNSAFAKARPFDAAGILGGTPRELTPDGPAVIDDYEDKLRRVLAYGQPEEMELTLPTPAGARLHHIRFVAERSDRGDVVAVLAIGRDITESKRAQISLIESERRYREIFENTSDSLYLLEATDQGGWRYLDVNPAFERVAGIPRAKLVGRDAVSGLASARAAAIIATHRRCIDTATVVDGEFEHDLPDGRHVFQCTLVPLIEETGRVHRIVGVARDVTTQVHNSLLKEQRLRVHEMLAQGARQADILDGVLRCVERIQPDFLACMMTLDDSGKHLRVSSAPRLDAEYVSTIDGIEPGQGMGCIGVSVWRQESVISENLESDPRCLHDAAAACAAGLVSCCSEPIFDSTGKVLGAFAIYRRRPGRPTEAHLELIHQVGYLLATVLERQGADTLRCVREREFRALVENSPDTVARFGRDGCRIYANPALASGAGVPAARLLGLRPGATLAILPEQAQHYEERVASVLLTGECASFDLTWRGTGGQTICSQIRLVPEHDPDGTICGVLAIGRDITALMAAQRQLATLVEALPDPMARLDTGGKILYANAVLAAFLNRPGSCLVGRTLGELVPDRLGLVRAAFERAIADAGPNVVEVPESHGERHFEIRHIPELDDRGHVAGVLCIARDITERKRSEQSMQDQNFHREAAREEERKHIARELHDELGQFLSALRLEMSMLRLIFGKENPVLGEKAEGMTALVDHIIRALRDLVSSLRPAVLDMGIASALDWLVGEFSIRSGIVCDLRVDEESVQLDANQTTMVFRIAQESLTNIARHSGATRASVTLERRMDEYALVVRDNGRGFDPANRDAKSFGLLGLQERAQMLGGRLDIRCDPGVSTTISATVPVSVALRR